MGNPIKYNDPSGYFPELVYEGGKVVVALYEFLKVAIPVVGGIILAPPIDQSKAGGTEKNVKNNKTSQNLVSGGNTSDFAKDKKKGKKKAKPNEQISDQEEKRQLKKFKTNERANEAAEKLGYDGEDPAESLKEDYVGEKARSKFNMKYDPKTGEVILESMQGGIQVPTGLFIK
jgi:hypothetical protein